MCLPIPTIVASRYDEPYFTSFSLLILRSFLSTNVPSSMMHNHCPLEVGLNP